MDAKDFPSSAEIEKILYSNNSIVNGAEITSNTIVARSGIMPAAFTSNVSNGTVNNKTVGNGDTLNVYNTGVASNTTINSGGILNVSNGGTIYNTSNSGSIYVANGGSGTDIVMLSNSFISIRGGSVDGMVVGNNASVQVRSSGTANNITLTSGAAMSIFDGPCYVTNTTVSSGATLLGNTKAGLDQDHPYGTVGTTVDGGRFYLYGQGAASSTIVDNGGLFFVYDNASAYDTQVTNNGSMFIMNNALATQIVINGGSIVAVYNGGTTSNVSASGENTIFRVMSNGASFDNVISDKATMSVYSNSLAGNNTINSGATLFVFNAGTVINSLITDSDTLFTVGLDGRAINTSVTNYASMVVQQGGETSNTVIDNYASLTVSFGGIIYDTTVSNNGLLTVQSGGAIGDTVYIGNGGSATIWAGAGGSISFIGDEHVGLTLTGLDKGGSATTVINDFKGVEPGNSDFITLEGVNQEDVVSVDYKDAQGKDSPDHVTLTLKDGSTITLHIIGAQDSGYSLSTSNGNLVYEVCFLAGTLIRTLLDNEVKVEDLRVGDSVITYDWKNQQEVTKKIKWVGYKHIVVNPQASYDDEAGYPVRISKNAIAENVPHKDLLVTPEHCLFFEGKFVPARMLVNNYSIIYDHSITEYTYYHVETEEHSVIWADGMLTETYLDTGNRNIFKQYEGKTTLFPQQSQSKNWEKDACAPLATDRSSIEPIFNELLNRAKENGFEKQNNNIVIDEEANLHLITDVGQIIYPHSTQKERLIFAVPKNTQSIYLNSKASRPSDAIGAFIDDRRKLGVLIGDITLLTPNQTYKIDGHLTSPQLKGWYNVENAPYRWTNGHALLPLEENKETDTMNAHNILVVKIVSGGPYIQEIKH